MNRNGNIQEMSQQRPRSKHCLRNELPFRADADECRKLFYKSPLLSGVGALCFHSCQDCIFQKSVKLYLRILTDQGRSPFISHFSALHQKRRAPWVVRLAALPLTPSPSEAAVLKTARITALFFFGSCESLKQSISAKA